MVTWLAVTVTWLAMTVEKRVSRIYIFNQIAVACEQEILALSCEVGVLNIVGANYGRTTDGVCGSNSAWSTECVSSSSLPPVQNVCQGKKACSVAATNSVFGDTCPGTHKYLDVDYVCELGMETVFLSEVRCSEGRL